MKSNTFLAVVVLLGAAATAQGQSLHGPYVGADVGLGSFDRPPGDEAGPGNDNSSMSFGLRLGYDFSNHFALEATYADHGKFSSSEAILCPESCPAPAFSAITTTVRSLGVNAVGIWPTSERTLVKALLGFTRHKAKVVDHSLSRTLDGPLLGVGFGARLSEKMEVSLEWSTSFLSGKDMDTAWARHMDGDTSTASLGLRWRF